MGTITKNSAGRDGGEETRTEHWRAEGQVIWMRRTIEKIKQCKLQIANCKWEQPANPNFPVKELLILVLDDNDRLPSNSIGDLRGGVPPRFSLLTLGDLFFMPFKTAMVEMMIKASIDNPGPNGPSSPVLSSLMSDMQVITI